MEYFEINDIILDDPARHYVSMAYYTKNIILIYFKDYSFKQLHEIFINNPVIKYKNKIIKYNHIKLYSYSNILSCFHIYVDTNANFKFKIRDYTINDLNTNFEIEIFDEIQTNHVNLFICKIINRELVDSIYVDSKLIYSIEFQIYSTQHIYLEFSGKKNLYKFDNDILDYFYKGYYYFIIQIGDDSLIYHICDTIHNKRNFPMTYTVFYWSKQLSTNEKNSLVLYKEISDL